jgi:hypothetical protein
MQDANEIMTVANAQANELIDRVREKANSLGLFMLENLHLIHPNRLAEIKKELRKFDAVRKEWK